MIVSVPDASSSSSLWALLDDRTSCVNDSMFKECIAFINFTLKGLYILLVGCGELCFVVELADQR